jgi:putative salt-induced outer membrane protein YdiY
MKLKHLIFSLICPLAGHLWARPQTDVIVMRNGDRFTCEIKKLERGVLYAGFDYVDGTVSIAWSKVARVESSQLFLVHTQDGSVYEGTLRTPETPEKQPVKIEVLDLTQNAATLERAKVVEMAQTAESFWRRLSGNIDSGLIYQKGNNTTQYNIGAEVRIKRDLWSGSAGFTSALSKSSGVAAATNNQARLRGLRLVGRKQWFYNGAAEFLQSSQQGINLQTTLGAGFGKFLKETNTARIAVSAGLAWQKTQYEAGVGSQSPPNALAGMFGADIHLFQFKKTSVDITASALPVLTEPGRLRTYVNTAYSIQIISNLWFKVSFYGNWDNRPPERFSGSDYGTSSSISWSFN